MSTKDTPKPPEENVTQENEDTKEDMIPIFWGPVTKRELLYFIEWDKKRREKRNKPQPPKENVRPSHIKYPTRADDLLRLKNMLKSDQQKLNQIVKVRRPLTELSNQNITTNSNDHIKKVESVSQTLTAENLKQLNNETKNSTNNDSNTSNHTYTLENSDFHSPSQVLNSTYDKIDEPEDTNVTANVSRNNIHESRKSLLQYRENADITHEASLLNSDKTIEATHLNSSRELSNVDKSVLSRFSNLELEDERASLTNISMTPLINTPVPKMIEEYLTPPVPRRSKSFDRHSRQSSIFSGRKNKSATTTPRKMSSTLITDLKAENCLVTGSPRSSATPEVFRSNKNHMWEPKKSLDPKSSQNAPKSKLPQLKKTPGKYDSIRSPIAGYIRGNKIQSMSKVSHSACLVESSGKRFHSETKGRSKIPQPKFTSVKKKLKLDPKVNPSTSSDKKSFLRD